MFTTYIYNYCLNCVTYILESISIGLQLGIFSPSVYYCQLTNIFSCVPPNYRSVKLTGPFVTMIYKMFLGDLLRFGIIYMIFLIGFTQGRCIMLDKVEKFCSVYSLKWLNKRFLG